MTKRPDEFALIEKYFAPLAGHGSFGLKDDAAMLDVPKGKALVVTNDAIAEGVHFLEHTDPKLIAQRAIRVNMSDLAAKGATPFSISIALGLADNWDRKWIARFAKGLESDCKQYSLSLCGGDTFCSPGGAVIAITAYGFVSRKSYASRLDAKPGDHLYVTGTIGDAVLGLQMAKANNEKPDAREKFLIGRYELPQPRVEAAKLVADHASAAMDISDGFAGDLQKLCKASRVSAEFNVANVPLSKQAAKLIAEKPDEIYNLLTGGDDYELLIAVPKSKAKAFERAAAGLLVPLTFLCKLESGSKGVQIFSGDGKAMKFTKPPTFILEIRVKWTPIPANCRF